MWKSENRKQSIIIYQNEFFNGNIVDTLVAPSVVSERTKHEIAGEDYEIVIYEDVVKGKEEKHVYPSWVVIKNAAGKGVFYLHGLEGEEISNFSSRCVPFKSQR